jgi:hypothetical protein
MLRAMRTLLILTSLLALTSAVSAQPVPAPEAPPADPAAPVAPTPTDPNVAPPQAAPVPAEELPPAPPPEPAPAPMPQYDGQVDANGQVHYTGEPPEEDYGYEDASYPPAEPDDDMDDGDDFKIPPFSIRLDPFNWLIEGRLGLELEVGVLDFMTVELTPIFVAMEDPPTFNFVGRKDPLTQESNGLGPMAGASLGVGFWIAGQPLNGYVLRVMLSNVGITYKSSDSGGVFDKVTHTERRLTFMFGSHTRISFFTLAGGIGLGYELNQQERCYTDGVNSDSVVTTSDCDGELQIALDDPGGFNGAMPTVADLNGWLHPVYLEGRFSIGVSFD